MIGKGFMVVMVFMFWSILKTTITFMQNHNMVALGDQLMVANFFVMPLQELSSSDRFNWNCPVAFDPIES